MGKPGTTKYGPFGQISDQTFNKFNFSQSQTKKLRETANYALSKETWSCYRTALRMLNKCSNETNKNLDLPLNESKTLTFIAWLLERNLTSSTVNSYLSGLRQAHISAGMEVPNLRSPLILQILEGKKHIDNIERNNGLKPTRLPMTPTIMKLLKTELKISSLPKPDKLLIWTVATTAFMGSFRIHELLCKNVNSFDPSFTLLHEDIKLKSIMIGTELTEILQINIKSEKSNKTGSNTIVDVYASGGILCPVKAYKKWKTHSHPNPTGMPVFRLSSGKPLTGKKFNEILKLNLNKHLTYTEDTLSSHSFRAGLPTLIGKLGYSDSEIKALGRWSSRAFEAYLKQPRTKRQEIAKAIGNMNL